MRDSEQISRRLRLRHLQVLVTVVQSGSMARAAEHLAISQPVVSKIVADLERTVGVTLLERGRRGVEPTLYGRALVGRGIAILNDVRSSVSELESLADPTSGELRIGSTEPVMGGLLAAIVDQLSRQYPRLALHITEDEPPDLLDRLRDRNIDLIIARLPSATAAPDMQVEPLVQEMGVVVAGAQNPWVRRRQIKLAELINEPWCLPPAESFPGSWIAQAFHECGLDVPRPNVTVYSIQMQNALLSTGRFLAIQPATMMHFSAKRLGLKVLSVDMSTQIWPIAIVTQKNRAPIPAAQLFVNSARQITKLMHHKRSK